MLLLLNVLEDVLPLLLMEDMNAAELLMQVHRINANANESIIEVDANRVINNLLTIKTFDRFIYVLLVYLELVLMSEF